MVRVHQWKMYLEFKKYENCWIEGRFEFSFLTYIHVTLKFSCVENKYTVLYVDQKQG